MKICKQATWQAMRSERNKTKMNTEKLCLRMLAIVAKRCSPRPFVRSGNCHTIAQHFQRSPVSIIKSYLKSTKCDESKHRECNK